MITARRFLDDNGEVWLNAQDLTDWLNESLLSNISPEGTTIKLELVALLGQAADPNS